MLVFVSFLIAFLITLCSVPIAKRLAVKIGLVDQPDAKRKLHRNPVPLIGGIVIFCAVLVSVSFCGAYFWYFSAETNRRIAIENSATGLSAEQQSDAEQQSPAEQLPPADQQNQDGTNSPTDQSEAGQQESSDEDASASGDAEGEKINSESRNRLQLIGLLIASMIILAVGVVDDKYSIRGRQKLAGQIIAAIVMIACGYSFPSMTIFGKEIQFGIFSYAVVCLWFLLGINSVNLLDGADGFATTIGLLVSSALCVIAISGDQVQYNNAILAAAMVGALLAFLRYNFPPASAYLGDAGSMLIGLFISALAIRGASKEATAFALFGPLALLAIPLFDTMAAIVRRQLTGRSIYTVDRGHLHHALMRKGFSPRKALLLFFAMCLMTAAGGTLSVVHEDPQYAIASILAVAIFLVVGRVFGFAEIRLLSNKLMSILRTFFIIPNRNPSNHNHVSVRLQGERDWDFSWQVLREFAEKSELTGLTMDLNLPWLHESFHAKYHKTDSKLGPDEQWTAEFPIHVDGRIIGRVDLAGDATDNSFYDTISVFADALTSLQPYFRQTMQSREDAATESGIISPPTSEDSTEHIPSS